MIRLAIIVSHPVQYYVPLYRRLAGRDDLEIRVFYTWHAGQSATQDHGFQRAVAWDIPMTDGYPFELVPNTARDPGSHHFWGLRNPTLVSAVLAWKPDAVHITGYAYASHLHAMRTLSRRGVPVLFRGDSHLLGRGHDWRWLLKRPLLRAIYRWPTAFLYVGKVNRAYFEELQAPNSKLFYCPHSIEVKRFAVPHAELEAKAAAWRQDLNITEKQRVLLFAGKFEDKKRPVALMRAILEYDDPRLVLIMTGDGALGDDVRRLAAESPGRFRVLPFQNQSRMPIVYRLGDVFVLPSAYGETWGLAVNEALACGRPVLVSDRVGCASDLVTAERGVGSGEQGARSGEQGAGSREQGARSGEQGARSGEQGARSGGAGENGAIFRADDWNDFRRKLRELCERAERGDFPHERLQAFAAATFSIEITERYLVAALKQGAQSREPKAGSRKQGA